MRIEFSLTPLEHVAPWGGRSLHWFALTDGVYHLEVGGHRLPLSEGVDHYLARLWEDLVLLAPAALEPVPADLVDHLRSDPSPEADATARWYGDHILDFGYVRRTPTCLWWRVDDELNVEWWRDGPRTRVTLPVDAFVTALTDFHHALMDGMEHRVRRFEDHGPPPGVDLDLAELRRTQDVRVDGLRAAFTLRDTDWAAVRAGARDGT